MHIDTNENSEEQKFTVKKKNEKEKENRDWN